MKIQALIFKNKRSVKIGNELRVGGSISWRHNNLGNLRWSPFQVGNINNFSVFPDYETGLKALKYQLELAATGKSKSYRADMTLREFFNTYAPSNDGNYPETYSSYIAKRLGVDVGIKINSLI